MGQLSDYNHHVMVVRGDPRGSSSSFPHTPALPNVTVAFDLLISDGPDTHILPGPCGLDRHLDLLNTIAKKNLKWAST